MKRVYLLLIVIMAVGMFFRLWGLADIPPGLYPDEAMNGNNALAVAESHEGFPRFGWRVFFPENNGREGLYVNIVSLSVRLFGNVPFAIRVVSALFGILTILGLFFLTRELVRWSEQRDTIALIASWLLAINFWHINFSRIGFRAIMAPFFLVWALYALYRIINGAYSRNAGIMFASIGGLLFGLGIHSYIAYRITPLLLVVPVISGMRYHKKFKTIECFPCLFALFILFAFVGALPLLMYYTEHPADFFGRTSQISIFSAEHPLVLFGSNIIKSIGMFFWQGDANWRHNFSGSAQLWWPVAIAFFAGILRGIVAIFGEKNKDMRDLFLLLFSWIMLLLLPVAVSAEGIPHALRAILVIPPVMILAALGIHALQTVFTRVMMKLKIQHPESAKQLLRIRKEAGILFFIILASIGIHTFNKYFQRWAVKGPVQEAFTQRYADIGRALNNLPAKEQKYVIVNTLGHVLVNGIPMPAQTVMFLTNTFSAAHQQEKHITYLLPEELNRIQCANTCVITLMEHENTIIEKLKNTIPGLVLQKENNVLILRKS